MDFSKIKLFSLLLLYILANPLFAQNKYFTNKRIAANLHYGFVLKNKTASGHLANQRPIGLELELNSKGNGKAEWQQIYKYPETGISLSYWLMDPKKPLGNQLGLVFYVQKHILKTNRVNIKYRIGAGLGYIEKRFDLYTNNQNNLISSRLNYVLNGRILFTYRLNKTISLETGVGIIHFSNGGTKMPNQGINLSSANIGIIYHFQENEEKNSHPLNSFEPYWAYTFSLAAASKNEYPVESKNFMVGKLGVEVGRQLNRKSLVLLGLDIFNDRSMKVWTNEDEAQKGKNYFKSGILVGHELTAGKIAIITDVGYLYYNPVKVLSSLYQRYGLRYFINDKISAAVAMNAHLAKADFVEWTIAYRLKK